MAKCQTLCQNMRIERIIVFVNLGYKMGLIAQESQVNEKPYCANTVSLLMIIRMLKNSYLSSILNINAL